MRADSNLRNTQETSSLSKITERVDNTWVTVARKGKKKARIIMNTEIPVAPARKATQSLTSKDKYPTRDSPKKAVTDRRLFVQLTEEHEWRKLSPAGVREVIVKKMAISPVLFGKVKPVHSGFALSSYSEEAREKILNAGNGHFLTGAKIEPATNWTPVIVPTVPATIRKEQGEVEVSKCMLTDEIERVCSIHLAHVKLYGGNKPGPPYGTWMAFFPTAPNASFRVFDESGIARKFK
ncbi:putative eka-like protein [Erysiphe necator]|uniref:Putative eka-like protein n=1 Tax=Uncinula necator TaxID=52586 RepID=A0A0B1P206_UNCNE|nr:putative eka-like protein [Erysiphe necator]